MKSTTTRDRWMAILYAATIFTSAFLLFQVQPLVSKSILPWFGGSPAVWTTCMLFFQSVLFLGYVYADISGRLRPAVQAVLQFVLLLVALALVRVLPDRSWQPADGSHPISSILIILGISVGLPFFVLSTTAPVIQSWFARSYPGRTPYRLYALSNVGSLLALLSYPLFFERRFDLFEQARYWQWGFAAYVALCGIAAVWLWWSERERPWGEISIVEDTVEESAAPLWRDYAWWLLLPALASVALLATTNHVCTDVAVMPFLWVVPLALYLVTFIIAFDHPRWYRRYFIAVLTVIAIYGAALVSREGLGSVKLYDFGTTGRCFELLAELRMPRVEGQETRSPTSPEFTVGFLPFLSFNFAAMFGLCMLCHGELARRRPHPRHLTAFYLMIALGGMSGGVAVSLVAPHVFKTFFEWQLMMYAGTIIAVTLILHALIGAAFPSDVEAARGRTGWAPLVTLILLLVPSSVVLLDMVEYLQVSNKNVFYRSRNFFGTLTIRERYPGDPARDSVVLQHGITAHGAQFVNPAKRGQPATYYSVFSGIGRTLNFYRRQPQPGGLKIGSVGLGAGTLAAFVGDGEAIDFYEIDPAVVEIAELGNWFTYLADCRARGGNYQIALGDARISLEKTLRNEGPAYYHVLALDAFSGDAIPVHLLTEEAVATYVQHLSTPDHGGEYGTLAVHISNRYLQLEPVVRGLAERFGLGMADVRNPRMPAEFIYASEWILLTHNQELLNKLKPYSETPAEPQSPAVLWTDARSNLFDVIRQQQPVLSQAEGEVAAPATRVAEPAAAR